MHSSRFFLVQQLLLISLLWTSSALSAQCPQSLPTRDMLPGYPPAQLPTDPPIDSRDACPAWRWVAEKDEAGAPCPQLPTRPGVDWIGGSLFDADPELGLPAALAPFCVYQLTADSSIPAAAATETLERFLEQQLRDGRLLAIESGCAAVGAMGRLAREPVWRSLGERFHNQTQAIELSEVAGDRLRSEAVQESARVRLAFLDTQPAQLDTSGPSDHGFALARLAEQLVCSATTGPGGSLDTAACPVEIVTRLALPIEEFSWSDPAATTLNWDRGGYFGTIDQLSQAVWNELRAWRDTDQEHLVLNLSLGWVGERFGGLERRVRDMPLPVRTLYRTLEVASCEGAMIVAAAGNRAGGPQAEDGPLLPGGWERRAAPDRKACERLLGAGYRSRRRGSESRTEEPLVYAAGGLHGDDRPLTNARPGSEPPRVAYADHAVVIHPSTASEQEAPSQEAPRVSVLTGSSVATTIVATTAAAVWSQRPELSRAQVMQLLESSGRSLGRRAEVSLDSKPPEVRRIGLCPALARALGCDDDNEGAADCPLTCPAPSPDPPRLSNLRGAPAGIDASVVQLAGTSPAYCGEGAFYRDPRAPKSNPCPERQFYGIWARPWTGPQPQGNPCMDCDLSPPPPPPGGNLRVQLQGGALTASTTSSDTLTLHVYIDPFWDPDYPLSSPMLAIGDQRIALPFDGELTPGSSVIFHGIDRALVQDALRDAGHSTVRLLFMTADGPTESPILYGS